MRAAGRQSSAWPLLLALVMVLAALGVLLWLRGSLVAAQKSVIDGTVRRFEAVDALGPPEDRSLVFADVESLASASENNYLVEVRVAKNSPEGAEFTVRPWTADLLEPEWRTNRRWQRLAIGARPDGWLYVQVNDSGIRAVNAAITALGLLLAGGLGLLLARQRGKEQELHKTIVELEARRAQVLQLERLALVGQLSANIFHDIKKPVLNIKHEVADALEHGGGGQSELLRDISAQTDLYLAMLRDLGIESFARSHDEESEWCDLGDALERSLRLVRYEQAAVVVTLNRAEGAEYLIQAVPHRLVQLFSNLALNALQAMGESGTLCITMKRTEDSFAISFEDSGPGIPPERRAAVFDPFETARASVGGSGLGLYICRQIVEDLGGSIAVDESPSLGGARMQVRLPAPELPTREMKQ